MEYKNHQKVANMLKEQNERIALKCAQLAQQRNNVLLQAKYDKIALKDLKKQHPFCRCLINKNLRQTVCDLKVRINQRMQKSKFLFNEMAYLERTCLYL